MGMNTEAALLKAIVADPDDDTPRLAFCDWIEENSAEGDPVREQAEFIRGQIELARVKDDSLPRRRLARRVREILEEYETEWLGALGDYVREWHFHRGFPDKVGIDAAQLERHAGELFAAWPLQRLWVTGMGDIDTLKHIPAGHTLTSLDLCYNFLDSDDLVRLADFSHLRGLRTLGLMFNMIDDDGARLLREHPFFQGLSLIRCGANPISAPAREKLREHFGERITFECERDDDHLYAIQDDRGFHAGFGKDDTQLLFRLWEHGVRVAIFDHEGNLLDILRRDVPQDEGASWEQAHRKRQEARRAWMQELRFLSATIRIKRFRFDDGEGIHGFNWWQDAFDDPNHPQAEVREDVERWLADGQFEWNFGGGNCWLDGTGEVTDT